MATFAPDFSLVSDSIDKLTKSIDHLQKCEKELSTPGFNIDQEIANKTLEIVQQEIFTKKTLRNYAAMDVPPK